MDTPSTTVTMTENEVNTLLKVFRNLAVISQGLELNAKEHPKDLGAFGMWNLGFETTKELFELLDSHQLIA